MYSIAKESIGILATIIVLISFTQSDERNIRIINAVGCIVFIIYGILIGAISIWFLNGILFVIHLIKLKKLNKS